MRKSRHAQPRQEGGAPEWMTTYSDMVTLLLAFFVLLFSYSVIDVIKFQQIMSSIQVTFLGQDGIMESSLDPSRGEMIELAVDHKFEDVLMTYLEVKNHLQEEGLANIIDVRIEDRGVVLEIQDRLLFDTGRAEIRSEARELLVKVAGILANVPNQIIVEGHTDNVPIQTAQYPSNWELSVDRAVRVVRYLSERQGIDPERFLATGYGEFQPVASNETVQGRAKNRRVNIVISEVNLLDREVDYYQ
ncbi:flagellar motor protein MotB [Dethiobacter alkaliphilus]|uniref:flagellar motor protein MotB n=1 Tax=Dethiobacter alkaliphilus TaxID=427926 RepID=UPI002225CB9D|nr:OmpA family protein [Dethiobacter alkaliphilus]MCW3488738.1 OmpA family protein [Dethiobacter alkaliphilus]